MAEPTEASKSTEASTPQVPSRSWTYESIGLEDWDLWVEETWGDDMLDDCKQQVEKDFKDGTEDASDPITNWLDIPAKKKLVSQAVATILTAWANEPFELDVELSEETKTLDSEAKAKHLRDFKTQYEFETEQFLNDFEIEYWAARGKPRPREAPPYLPKGCSYSNMPELQKLKDIKVFHETEEGKELVNNLNSNVEKGWDALLASGTGVSWKFVEEEVPGIVSETFKEWQKDMDNLEMGVGAAREKHIEKYTKDYEKLAVDHLTAYKKTKPINGAS
ncbi:MAG: hypothetical protein Q9220_001826 [cf. Caloplaca sp. 1 TL-2023]